MGGRDEYAGACAVFPGSHLLPVRPALRAPAVPLWGWAWRQAWIVNGAMAGAFAAISLAGLRSVDARRRRSLGGARRAAIGVAPWPVLP